MPGIAPSKSSSLGRVLPQRSLMTALVPPIGLALPCSTLATVRPPARSRSTLTSVGSRTSPMPVIELTVVPPSLIESAAMCECASMMPGETKRPDASMTSAPGGTWVSAPPTAAILPSRRTIVPF